MIEVPDRKGSPVSSSSRATVVRTERPAAPRSTGIFLLIAAVLGLAAAFELILSELQVLRDPLGELACDINPLITCSTSLLSGQSRLLFDIPNSLIGIMAFTALATFAVIIISRVNLPRWVWWCMGAGTLVGVTYVAFFLHVSISVFQGLCPYCMLVWVATLATTVLVWAQILASGMAGESAVPAGRSIQRYWWLILLLLLLIIAVIIAIGLTEQISMVFG